MFHLRLSTFVRECVNLHSVVFVQICIRTFIFLLMPFSVWLRKYICTGTYAYVCVNGVKFLVGPLYGWMTFQEKSIYLFCVKGFFYSFL